MNKQNHILLRNYFVWTFILSWILWLPGVLAYFGLLESGSSLLKILEIAGAISPAIVALTMKARLSGKDGVTAILRSCVDIRSQWKFWLAAASMLAVLHAAARLVLVQVSASVPAATISSPLQAIALFIVYFLVGGGLGEEIGWRGFALERLQERFSALNASLFLSAIWIVWHLPLFFYGGTNQSLIPFWLFILPVIALSILLTWVYNNTHTIFAVAFFHTAGNICHDLFRVVPDVSHPGLSGFIILTIFYAIAAIVVIWVYGAKTLSHHKTTYSKKTETPTTLAT